jgi:Tfp pilus assembly protein FimT
MNIRPAKSQAHSGIMLFECLVYIALFFVITGVAFCAFYSCWNNSIRLRKNADDITHTLNVGEQWREDIRRSTGPITVENQADSQRLHVPTERGEIIYAFREGRVERKSTVGGWIVLLPKVTASKMEADNRVRVKAWRWEVELSPVNAEAKLRPLFTFEAVQPISS